MNMNSEGYGSLRLYRPDKAIALPDLVSSEMVSNGAIVMPGLRQSPPHGLKGMGSLYSGCIHCHNRIRDTEINRQA